MCGCVCVIPMANRFIAFWLVVGCNGVREDGFSIALCGISLKAFNF